MQVIPVDFLLLKMDRNDTCPYGPEHLKLGMHGMRVNTYHEKERYIGKDLPHFILTLSTKKSQLRKTVLHLRITLLKYAK